MCVHIGASITPFCPIGQNDVMDAPMPPRTHMINLLITVYILIQDSPQPYIIIMQPIPQSTMNSVSVYLL